jgi:hypothetical protein
MTEAIRKMRSLLFLVVTQRVVVNPPRRFGTIYRFHLQGSINLIYIAAVALNNAAKRNSVYNSFLIEQLSVFISC